MSATATDTHSCISSLNVSCHVRFGLCHLLPHFSYPEFQKLQKEYLVGMTTTLADPQPKAVVQQHRIETLQSNRQMLKRTQSFWVIT